MSEVTDQIETSAVAEPSGREKTRTLVTLTVCHTINDFYGLVLPPLLPVLRDVFELSYTQMGVIPFVSTAVSAVLQPVLGYSADRRQQRRQFMALGFGLFAVSMLWLSTVDGYLMLVLAAALLGLSGATYHPQSATFLIYYFRLNRGFAQGIHGIGNGVGFALAPLSFGFLAATVGWEWALRILAIPALIAAVIVLRLLREPALVGSQGLFSGITRPLILLTLVNGLSLGVTTGFIVWLPTYYTQGGYSIFAAGALTAAMSGAALIAQPFGGTISDRLGRRNVVTASLIGVAIFQAFFIASPVVLAAVISSVLVGFFGSLLPPVSMVYASELAAGHRTGTAVGVVWGLGTAISSFAPLLTGIVIDSFGILIAYALLIVVALFAAGLSRALPGRT
jgi:MFS transporter, FSR family, fosmidomycin resistance protein